MALEVIDEGLKLRVPNSGLSSAADNVLSWREHLSDWQAAVSRR